MNLRQELRLRRRNLHASPQEAATIALRISQLDIFINSQNIAFYFMHDHEVDPKPLYLKACALKKNCYFPRINSEVLEFVKYQNNDPLVKNKFGIPEPSSQEIIAIKDLDLVFVPLLGFDKNCNRIGSGAGFYDRTFAANPKPCLIGLAYDCQLEDSLKVESWDVPMDFIITETRIFSRLNN